MHGAVGSGAGGWKWEDIEAEEAAGCDQIPKYPRASPDFNAIEGWWRRLKMHLEQGEPIAREPRCVPEAFAACCQLSQQKLPQRGPRAMQEPESASEGV